jgi:aminoglycoside phosphotransferase (APT) family kinase protein
MKYIETYTRIPIPHVIHYCVEADGGGVGSPYILMSKVDGVSLCSV